MLPRNVITTEAQIGRRRESRLRVRLAARVVTLDGTCRVVLADISQNGARIDGAGALPPLRLGQEIVVAWSGHDAFGQVVWLSAGLCGIAFEEPVSEAVLTHTRTVDERDHLPGEHEIVRRHAQAFVQGRPVG